MFQAKKKMKTILAGVTALTATAALLSGCGSSDKGEESSGGSKAVTLTMIVSGNKAADGQDFELDVLPKMVNEKFPNIKLEVQKLPDDQ